MKTETTLNGVEQIRITRTSPEKDKKLVYLINQLLLEGFEVSANYGGLFSIILKEPIKLTP